MTYGFEIWLSVLGLDLGFGAKGFGIWLRVLGLVLWDWALGLGFWDLA